MKKSCLVTIADGSEDLETVTIVDVLRRAGIEVTVASVGKLQVTCARGVKIEADAMLENCLNRQYDMIAIPGGLPGAEHLRDSAVLRELLLKQEREKRQFAAICAAPALVLQTHGLLENRKATCYPAFAEKLTDKSSTGNTVVVDKKCITSQGPGTAIEFSLKLVEELVGMDVAGNVAEAMLVTYP